MPLASAAVSAHTRGFSWSQQLCLAQVALPEIDGALEPIVFAGRDSATGRSHSLPERIDLLCNRSIKWAK